MHEQGRVVLSKEEVRLMEGEGEEERRTEEIEKERRVNTHCWSSGLILSTYTPAPKRKYSVDDFTAEITEALHVAALCGHTEILALLLSKGVAFSLQTSAPPPSFSS